MMRKEMDKLNRLKEQFPASDIGWRICRSGVKNDKVWAQLLAYVTARACQERLDEVLGVLGWQTDYERVGEGFLCRLKVKYEDEWITKTDGAQITDFEPYKGGISGAFKRACSAGLGIGRYLYYLTDTWANTTLDRPPRNSGWNYASLTDKTPFWWLPPELPTWALPGGAGIPFDKQIDMENAVEIQKHMNTVTQSRKENQNG